MTRYEKLPFKYVEPDIWQIPLLVVLQALVAFGANLAGWNIDPLSFFFIPLVVAILFWREQSYKIITDYFGFNTKNITQKILASVVGACLGISLYLVLKYSRMSLIPYASYRLAELSPISGTSDVLTTIYSSLPIILTFAAVLIAVLLFVAKKLKPTHMLAIIITLLIPFMFIAAQPVGILNLIIGYGEEILCLIFAMIAINWLVYNFNLKYNNPATHAAGWVISRASWAVIHALSSYGFVLGAYVSAFVLGMIFTLIGYMFWFTELAIPILLIFGGLDLYYYYLYGIDTLLYLGIILMVTALGIIVDRKIFRDDSLAFKEYVIYGAAMAHAFYDLSFVLFA